MSQSRHDFQKKPEKRVEFRSRPIAPTERVTEGIRPAFLARIRQILAFGSEHAATARLVEGRQAK
jgi:hypothetical protein